VLIIEEWSKAERNVARGTTVEALSQVLLIPDRIAQDMTEDFDLSCEGISKMLRNLIAWLRSALISYSEVCVLGI
jgi:exopolyphosphatase/pppGpp-phosphohydrolase